MKYLIITEGKICQQLASNFIPELERFDIRNDIEVFNTPLKNFTATLKKSVPDLIIVFGGSSSHKIVRLARKNGVKSCFFYQSLLSPNQIPEEENSHNHKLYPDLPPIKTNQPLDGSLLIDVLRKTNRVDTYDSTTVSLASLRESKWITKVCERLSQMNENINFKKVVVSSGLEEAIIEIQKSHAVIAVDQFSNILAALSNSPLINVYQEKIFTKAQNRLSKVNEMLDKNVVGNYSNKNIALISEQLDRILNDYNYSAGMMDDFQQLKSIIGTQPFSRVVAQEVVNWLET
ncbi:hypothetical protein [Ekhidna sp.]|uniref:hypothetical protein n=1 Tax=Ekhidna sp. TaxID=2608089 RepID=UPI003CCBBDEA